MNVWKVEIWVMLTKDSLWDKWDIDYIACDNITEAISKAIAIQNEKLDFFAIEVRSVTLELTTSESWNLTTKG